MPKHPMSPKKSPATPLFRPFLASLTLAFTACSHPAPPPPPPVVIAPPIDIPPIWTLHLQRRQTTYLPLNLPVVTSGMHIDIALPTSSNAPAPWVEGTRALSLYSTHILRGTVTGPAVDQLTGYPETPTDRGSYLLPIPPASSSPTAADARFLIRDPMPLYLKLDISPLQDPGKYLFPITLTLPGKPPDTQTLEVDISPITLPTQPRVLAVATTTADALTRIFPAAFAPTNPRYLDRTDPDQPPCRRPTRHPHSIRRTRRHRLLHRRPRPAHHTR